ncbi:hypothetical protein DACRYDRAFT_116737 [Dacryopinax primogenitus]|uniref:Concanavalin A-like lectin/glucanase n=1 Tax=Dacryopinax primogenitus (strain DJM 731) TaxID=1858805 RepID=M5FYR4_DACPD|nr:uncharacterized protein DACRYDRAFT_116737 [Dacryopinax primogenitus]EJU01654.1 hypothetical protein DACRYDRAFT_116737 [Dacryopinax primogenitus]
MLEYASLNVPPHVGCMPKTTLKPVENATGSSLAASAYAGNILVSLPPFPPAPPPEVTTGPWYFWCGVQPSGGGVIQPVLGYRAGGEENPVNPDPPFPQVWALNIWALPWNYGPGNGFQLQESQGIWVAEGDQIASTVTWEQESQDWIQTAEVVSGLADGNDVWMVSDAYNWESNGSGDDNTREIVCESELYGNQISYWNFSVVFTDVTFRAANSNGVEYICSGQTSHSDGNGYITFKGFEMLDDQTCYWSSITLTAP